MEGARRNRVFSKYRIICINYISLLHGYAASCYNTKRDGKGKRGTNQQQQQQRKRFYLRKRKDVYKLTTAKNCLRGKRKNQKLSGTEGQREEGG